MNSSRLAGLVVFFAIVAFLFPSHSWAQQTASLKDVHDVLLQAAGDSADQAPSIDQQKSLLADALKKLRQVPHVYHGKLNEARRDIEAAMTELSGGDATHKARHDILDAADVVKGLMD